MDRDSRGHYTAFFSREIGARFGDLHRLCKGCAGSSGRGVREARVQEVQKFRL